MPDVYSMLAFCVMIMCKCLNSVGIFMNWYCSFGSCRVIWCCARYSGFNSLVSVAMALCIIDVPCWFGAMQCVDMTFVMSY